jgi:hypothetical protein
MKKYSNYIQIPVYIIICILLFSCSGNEDKKMGNKFFKEIEFLGRSDCSHSPAMEKNLLSALENTGLEVKYKYIDLASLPTNDYRRGYGTPTVLINGDDLFGMARPMPTVAVPT